MKFYRLHMTYDNGSSAGYEYFTSKGAADKRKREHLSLNPGENKQSNEIDVIEVKPTKAGILDALNRFGDHPDNG